MSDVKASTFDDQQVRIEQIGAFIRDDLLAGTGGEFGVDDELLELGIIDSLGLLDIVLHLEDTYGVAVDDAEVTLDNFGSVSAIASFVGRLLEGAG